MRKNGSFGHGYKTQEYQDRLANSYTPPFGHCLILKVTLKSNIAIPEMMLQQMNLYCYAGLTLVCLRCVPFAMRDESFRELLYIVSIASPVCTPNLATGGGVSPRRTSF